MYPPNHKYYYVITESVTENEAMNKRKIAEEALQKCKSLDPNKKIEFIILNSNKNNIRNMDASVKCVQSD